MKIDVIFWKQVKKEWSQVIDVPNTPIEEFEKRKPKEDLIAKMNDFGLLGDD